MDQTAMHPRRAGIHATHTLGDESADVIAAFVGSWRAVWLHAVWFAAWLLLRLDINLLTLIVSLEAIFLCIFLLMSQNRQSAKDRLRDDREAQEVEEMFGINKTQLDILRGQDEILARLDALTAVDSLPVRDAKTGRFTKRLREVA